MIRLKEHKIFKIVILVIAVSLLINVVGNYFSKSKTQELVIPVELTTETEIAEKENEEVSQKNVEAEKRVIYAEIKGEVKQPGVYQLEEGARVFDLIDLAGGLTNEAINQAMLISDQMSLSVPNINDWQAQESQQMTQPPLIQVGDGNTSPSTNGQADTLVNINTADNATLQTLPGIGVKKAEAIILYREEQGSFQTIEDILNISGIGAKSFEKLAPLITVE